VSEANFQRIAGSFSAKLLEAAGSSLRSLRDQGMSGWELVRINPLEFADEFDFKPEEAASLFILGAKAGLFTFEWSLL
jgi:hypothetical protein